MLGSRQRNQASLSASRQTIHSTAAATARQVNKRGKLPGALEDCVDVGLASFWDVKLLRQSEPPLASHFEAIKTAAIVPRSARKPSRSCHTVSRSGPSLAASKANKKVR